ncbi:hypothetical protein NEF87_000347 [Candidatus Lokiarchaeum ossiferum]|uniref:4Fe-4S ferredoxin-type domain-containing protein n=1 Tax=Candidatus Lokiarchaeum ossiferum TaxID=2951803 RepID=A0ABY6HNT8_9ARCH|nr:hypothetical protein NEF87_000347 [Candidatus Lokiarchaeum sp. B-35]
MIFQAHLHVLEPAKMIPVFLVWILAMAISLILLFTKKLTKLLSIAILTVSFIVTGLIFGAMPNPVFPIQNIAVGINMNAPLQQLLPLAVILLVLIVTTILFGRIFCSYACPLGAIQEIMSKIQFKTSLKAQKKEKTIPLNSKIASYIRLGYFILFIGAGIIWGASVIQYLNIFIGLQIFANPLFPMIVIPAVLLGIIIITSILVYRPWCRLFCPFGTIAGFTSRFSKFVLCRTEDCTDCGLCEKICPTQEAELDSKKGECYLCNRCVEICPQNAIVYKTK